MLAAVSSAMLAVGLLAACTSSPSSSPSPSPSPSSSASPPGHVAGGPSGTYLVSAGIHKIKHVIIVMQENRSFDSYFGT
ncbi:MAG: alkaline phosphatase family protein, partial [Streptosporangiaceae bacterium]